MFVCEEIADQKTRKKDHQTAHESGFEFVQMLPEAHYGATGFMRLILNLIHGTLSITL